MKEDDRGLLEVRLVLGHVVVDVLLQELLVLTPHLRAHGLDGLGAVGVQLATTLLSTAHVFGLRLVDEHFVILIDLQDELASMAEDQDPVDHWLAENPQWIEGALLLMLGYLLQDLLVPPYESSWVTEVNHLGQFFTLCEELELLLSLIILLFLSETFQECLVKGDKVFAVCDGHIGLVVVQSMELLHELKVSTVLAELSEADRALLKLKRAEG